MTQTAMCYGTVLYELSVPETAVEQAKAVIEAVPETVRVLQSPVISLEKKERVIERIFPAEMKNFLKVVCKYGNAALLAEIFSAYRRVYCEKNGILPARLTYVTAPDERQLAGIRELLKERYQAETVDLELKEDKSLMGGFVIEAAGQETDCSLKGRLARLEERLTRR